MTIYISKENLRIKIFLKLNRKDFKEGICLYHMDFKFENLFPCSEKSREDDKPCWY